MKHKGFTAPVRGVGLGLHRSLLDKIALISTEDIDFLEISPENWINVGGRLGKKLRSYTERFPFVCHGLSLSLGSPAPLNKGLLTSIKEFLSEHNIHYYSEHLSYSGDTGNLYELLPMPMTEEAVHYLAARIRQAQDIIGERIAIENATYYFRPAQDMTEREFINAVLAEADCALLLDVNNLFVNSNNHNYNALEFLKALDGDKIAYIHIAGHDSDSEEFLVDTHGAPIASGVWRLLEATYSLWGVKPTLLERDNNIPPLNDIMQELDTIKGIQEKKP